MAFAVHIYSIIFAGLIGLSCVAGGMFGVYLNAKSDTSVKIFGMDLSTGSVGVVFMAIGLLVALRMMKAVFASQRDIAGERAVMAGAEIAQKL